jgi:hypothetical protein
MSATGHQWEAEVVLLLVVKPVRPVNGRTRAIESYRYDEFVLQVA